MAIREDHLEPLRARISTTIQRATDLFADPHVARRVAAALLPALARMTESERQRFVARLCGYEPGLPDHVQLVPGLADLLGGLTPPTAARPGSVTTSRGWKRERR